MDIYGQINEFDKKIINQILKPEFEEFSIGEKLYSMDTECKTVSYIVNGRVLAKEEFTKNNSTIVRTLNAGEYIGLNLLFSSNPAYKCNFYADEPTTIITYTKSNLVEAMHYSSDLMKNVLRVISDTSIKFNEHIKLVSHKTIRSKICYYLYQQYQENGNLKFKVKATKTDLAKILNVERPSLSYIVSQIEEDGIIKNHNRDYEILDLEKLKMEL